MERAAGNGDLERLVALYESGEPITPMTIVQAASNGRLGVVRWLIDNGFGLRNSADGNLEVGRVGNYTMAIVEAAAGGQRAIVDLIRSKSSELGLAPDYITRVVRAAAINGHHGIIRSLVDVGEVDDFRAAMEGAIAGHQLATVKYLCSQRIPSSNDVLASIRSGCTELAKFLLTTIGSFDDIFMVEALRRRNVELVKYIVQNHPFNRSLALHVARQQTDSEQLVNAINSPTNTGPIILSYST